MANINLNDLPQANGVENGDLFHLSRDGIDYAINDEDLFAGINEDIENTIAYNFDINQSLLTQAEALPTGRVYYGTMGCYGKDYNTLETPPANSNWYVKVHKWPANGDYLNVECWGTSGSDSSHWFNARRGGTWSGWMRVVDSKNFVLSHSAGSLYCSSTSPLTFKVDDLAMGYAAGIIIFGILQGVGGLVLKFRVHANTLSVMNMDGSAFSSTYVSFSYNSTNHTITITPTNTGSSTVMVFAL